MRLRIDEPLPSRQISLADCIGYLAMRFAGTLIICFAPYMLMGKAWMRENSSYIAGVATLTTICLLDLLPQWIAKCKQTKKGQTK